jgi:SAM-dependent methyltransferase
MECPDCHETVPIEDGVLQFPVTVEERSVDVFDLLSGIYESPLWFPIMYRLAGGPFAPLDDRRIANRLLDPADRTVLDVACGTGRLIRYIADDAASVWGVDLSAKMLREARQYVDRNGIENVTLAKMGANELYFEADSFDRVACCWALHFFSDIPGALAEIRRVLHPDGVFAGTTLTDEYILGLPGVRNGVQQTADAHIFEQQELDDLLGEAGFQRVEFERRGSVLFFRAQA